MAAHRRDTTVLAEAIKLVEAADGNVAAAARKAGLHVATLHYRYMDAVSARERGELNADGSTPQKQPAKGSDTEYVRLKDEIRMLRASLAAQKREEITYEAVGK